MSWFRDAWQDLNRKYSVDAYLENDAGNYAEDKVWETVQYRGAYHLWEDGYSAGDATSEDIIRDATKLGLIEELKNVEIIDIIKEESGLIVVFSAGEENSTKHFTEEEINDIAEDLYDYFECKFLEYYEEYLIKAFTVYIVEDDEGKYFRFGNELTDDESQIARIATLDELNEDLGTGTEPYDYNVIVKERWAKYIEDEFEDCVEDWNGNIETVIHEIGRYELID